MIRQRSARHHTVPRFYLRRFADYDGRLRAHNVVTDEILERQHVRNVAVERGFHTLAGSGDAAVDIEAAFGHVEGKLAEALRSIDRRFPPTPAARATISTFVAFQFVRSARWRTITHDAISDGLKWSGALEAAYILNSLSTEEATAYVRRRLNKDEMTADQAHGLLRDLRDQDYELEIDHGLHLRQLLDVLSDPDYAGWVSNRSWVMCHTDAQHEFLISDHPVAVWGSPQPGGGAGLSNAAELSLPVDRRRLLLMTLEPKDDGKRREVSAVGALSLNQRVRASALRFVYGHTLVRDDWLRGRAV